MKQNITIILCVYGLFSLLRQGNNGKETLQLNVDFGKTPVPPRDSRKQSKREPVIVSETLQRYLGIFRLSCSIYFSYDPESLS